MNDINKNFVFHSNASPSFSTTISSISRHPYFFPYYSPPSVHLHPQTFGHHFNNSKSRFELIDGYLIKQKMVDGTHRAITLKIIYFLSKAAAALDKKLYIDTETDVFIPSRQKASLEHLLEVVKSTQSSDVSSSSSCSSSPARSKSSKSTNSSSNSTPSSSSKKANYRPDISVYDVRPQEMKDGKLKSIKPPIMVFEVTSDNRATDLTKKWTNYLRANIPEYIIVDRDQTHEQSTDSPSVIVGKLGKSWSLAPSENPTVSAKSNRNISHHSEHQMYPREVYEVDDPRVVDCSFIKMTAREMLTPVPLMECIMKDIEEAEQREEEGRKREESLKREKEEGRKRGESLKREKEEARKRGEESLKREKEEGRKIEEARKRGEEEGRKSEKEEARKIIESVKRERDELLNKLKASEAKPNEPLVNKSTANGQFSPRKRERRNSADSYNSGSSVAAKSSNGSVKGSKPA